MHAKHATNLTTLVSIWQTLHPVQACTSKTPQFRRSNGTCITTTVVVYYKEWDPAATGSCFNLCRGRIMSEERNLYHKRWRDEKAVNDPFYSHKKALKELYKTTKEWYDAKLLEQNNHCALCPATQQSASGKRLSVDHDHDCCPTKRACGKCNRGLLCFNCNKRLGHLEAFLYESFHRPEPYDGTWLERALKYLDSYKRI
jgi:hypothetical protein